jgi:hypothetical protein
MFSLLYRKLPGSKGAKITQMICLALIFIACLIIFVFPFVDGLIPEDPAING